MIEEKSRKVSPKVLILRIFNPDKKIDRKRIEPVMEQLELRCLIPKKKEQVDLICFGKQIIEV